MKPAIYSLQDELTLFSYLHLKVCLRFSCHHEESKPNLKTRINFKHNSYSLISKVRWSVQILRGPIQKHVLPLFTSDRQTAVTDWTKHLLELCIQDTSPCSQNFGLMTQKSERMDV